MKQTVGRWTVIIAVVVVLHLDACATGVIPRDAGRRPPQVTVTLTISNLTTLPLRIYLRRSVVDVALGTVQGLSSRTFELADRLVTDASQLQLEARDRHGFSMRSDTFILGAKHGAEWQVDHRSTRVDVR
jgi:hypothetical protein